MIMNKMNGARMPKNTYIAAQERSRANHFGSCKEWLKRPASNLLGQISPLRARGPCGPTSRGYKKKWGIPYKRIPQAGLKQIIFVINQGDVDI